MTANTTLRLVILLWRQQYNAQSPRVYVCMLTLRKLSFAAFSLLLFRCLVDYVLIYAEVFQLVFSFSAFQLVLSLFMCFSNRCERTRVVQM